MLIALQIAIGIWLGGLLLVGTFTGFFTVKEHIERNRRYGYPWYRSLFVQG